MLRKSSDVTAIEATIELDSEAGTRGLILAVLRPEFARHNGRRSSVKIKPSTHGLKIRVKARDLSSFKASVTSALRLLSVILEMQRTIKKGVGG